jgi:hypothetical protein
MCVAVLELEVSRCVCVGCADCDLYVPRAGCPDSPACYEPAELWRFGTSTRRWEKVKNTAVNGAAPSSRTGHVITSVGLDLWIHGGLADSDSGEGGTCSRPSPSVLWLLLH